MVEGERVAGELMKMLVVLLAAVATLSVLNARPALEWQQWRAEHGRRYQTTAEERTRREIWTRNHDSIQKHNARNHGITLKLNHFADMVS